MREARQEAGRPMMEPPRMPKVTQKAMAEGVLVVRGHQVKVMRPVAREERVVVRRGEESLLRGWD